MAEAERIRVDRILVPPNLPTGMNPFVIMSLAHLYRSTTEDAPPIEVTREGRYYRVTDGRHRFVASLVAGRRRVLAIVADKPM
jgi:hypothetical protein